MGTITRILKYLFPILLTVTTVFTFLRTAMLAANALCVKMPLEMEEMTTAPTVTKQCVRQEDRKLAALPLALFNLTRL